MSFVPVDAAAHERFLASFLLSPSSLLSYGELFVGDGADSDDLMQEGSLIRLHEFAHYDPARPFIA